MATLSSPPGSAPISDGPLSIEHQRELADAVERVGKLMPAIKLATFNAWTTGTLAALSLLLAVFSVTAGVVGLALAVIAWNEFRGRNMLRWFDRRGPRVLGWNQLGFLCLLIGYAAWSIWANLSGASPYEPYLSGSPELQSLIGPIGQLHKVLTLAVYGGLIVLSAVFQGLNALYYFSRQRHLHLYLSQTPQWIVQLQRSWVR